MLRFVVRRLLLLVPILVGVSLLVFVWIRALPGSPAQSLLGERATPQLIKQANHQYGLDRPIYVQYWKYVDQTTHFRLGTSIASSRTVGFEIRNRRARRRGDGPRGSARDPARILGGEAVRNVVRPREPRRVTRRDLGPDLL